MKLPFRSRTDAFAWIATAGVLLTTGCASWRDAGVMKLARKIDVPNGVPWKEDAPRFGDPRRMVVTWTDAVRQQPGAASERGFGGRIFFYDHDETHPIKVNGQLVVYAFDETDRLPTDNRPTKRYVFPAAQFAKHESDSDLGLSYSVWLPWGDSRGPQTEVSLIARFEPTTGGNLVVSDQTKQRLPGTLDGGVETMVAGQPSGTAVRQTAQVQPPSVKQDQIRTAGYQAPAPGVAPATRQSNTGLETTTIKLPSRSR